MGMWLLLVALAAMAVAGYTASRDEARVAIGIKLASWSLRIGGAAVLDFNDKVRLANTPTYGHRVYTSPDGRVLVIDPITPTAETFAAQAGAVEMPKRVVLQVTSFGQAAARAELSHHEAFMLTDAVRRYLKDSVAVSAGDVLPHSQR